MNISRSTSGRIDAQKLRARASHVARILKTIGNEKRLMILCALTETELTVGELNDRVDLTQSALSQHLAVLRRDGIVSTRREAQSIYYSIANRDIASTMGFLYATFCK